MPQQYDLQPYEEYDLQPYEEPKSLLQQWDDSWVNQPLSKQITSNGQQIFDPKYAANYYDAPEARTENQWKIPEFVPGIGGGTWRSLGAGMLEGAGNVIEGFTTPLNLATMAAFGGAGSLGASARTLAEAGEIESAARSLAAARMAARAGKVLSAPMAATGAEQVYSGLTDENGVDWSKVGFGGAQVAGGLAGLGAELPTVTRAKFSRTAYDRTAPGEPPPQPLRLGEGNVVQGEVVPEPPPPPPKPTPPVRPQSIPVDTVTGEQLPQVISSRGMDAAALRVARSQGYVSIPGLRGEDNYPLLVHKDVAPLYANRAKEDRIKEDLLKQAAAGPVPSDTVPTGDTVNIPKENINDTVVNNMIESGYEPVDQTPTHWIFKRLISEDEGTFDPQQMLERQTRQPEQLSMEGQMKDAEIADYLRREDTTPPEMQDLSTYEPQEMRVPKVKEGNTGLANVALGGADPRVWDVMGSSLYARKRPVTTIKELLQNAWDEHKELGVKEPVRVLIDKDAPNPRGGDNGKSITVRDRGRGLQPEQIYTVLTNLGATGKAGVQSAAGGFGFAKAAPFTGGQHVTVRSVVDTPSGRMMYTFEGTPSELKNQVKGVPLNAEPVGPEIPTGLEVTTFYHKDIPGFYETAKWAQNMAERSPSVESSTKIAETYDANPVEARRWLDETSQNPIGPNEYNYLKRHAENDYSPQPIPTLMDTIDTPGADVNIHYDIAPGVEASQADLHLTNKGMYQGTNTFSYGEQTANVPRSIVADIVAKVEEGHEAYPFSANREQISDEVNSAIDKWIKDNIITGVTQKRIAEIQKQYDAIGPLPTKQISLDYLDDGHLLTPGELGVIVTHPKMIVALQALKNVHEKMLAVADSLGWTPESYNATWTLPSQRLKKFGLLFKGPDNNGTTLGIHIPRPNDMNNSAILFNLMEHLNDAEKHATPVNQLATAIISTLAHEQAHIPGGSHDKSHSYRDADLRSKFGAENTIQWIDDLKGAFDDGKGNIDPEISKLLQIYNGSRQRTPSGPNAILATGIPSQRQPGTGTGAQGDTGGTSTGEAQSGTVKGVWQKAKEATGWGQGITNQARGEAGTKFIDEALGLAKSANTIADYSALKQTASTIFTKEYWKGAKRMVQAGWSDELDNDIHNQILSMDIFQSSIDPMTGRRIPSWADKVGFKVIGKGTNLSERTELIASNWLENGRFFGLPDNPISRAYAQTWGRVARASTRAFRTQMNYVAANRLKYLADRARDMAVEGIETGSVRQGVSGMFGIRKSVTPDEAINLNPYHNLVLGREISDFVRTASGQAPLKVHIVPYKGAEWNLESSAKTLTRVLFAPRSLFTKFRMLNPSTYVMATPYVRKQYLQAAVSTMAAWLAITKMIEMAGPAMGGNVKVSWDPDNSDYGKVRIGNTRLDFGQGYLPFLVSFHRLLSGRYVSSGTGMARQYGKGYQAATQLGQIGRTVIGNKLEPFVSFATDLLDATEYKPFHVGDRTLQLFIPMVAQDMYELLKTNPKLLPFAAPPIVAGAASQTYGGNIPKSKFIPPQYDWVIKHPHLGGDLFRP